MANTIATFLFKWRWIFVLFSLSLVVALTMGSKHIQYAADYEVWFSDNNPQYLAFSSIQKTYAKSDNVVILLTPKDGEVFSTETLASIEWLTAQAWKIPFSTRVESLSNFQHSYADGDDLVVADLIRQAEQKSAQELEQIKTIALSEPLLLNRIISPDAKVTALNITINLPNNSTEGSPMVTAYTRDLVKKLQQQNPNLQVHLTGLVVMDNAFVEASMEDMGSLTLIMFALILVGLLIFLRNITATISILIIIIASIMATMGFSGWYGIQLTPVSASAPTIVMTIAVANAVHVLMTLLHAMRMGMDKRAAIQESLQVNLQPVILATITTMVGFLTMHFSDVPPFHDLGKMVVVGVMVSFLLSMTLIPWLIMLLPIRVKKQETQSEISLRFVADFVIANNKTIIGVFVALTIGMAALIPLNVINDNIWEYFDTTVQFRVDTDYASEHLTGPYYLEYSLESNQNGGISSPEYLNSLDQFRQWLDKQPEVVHVNSLSDILKRLNKNLNKDDPAYYRLPENRELSAQYLLLYEMSLPYGLDLNSQINVDKSSSRVIVSLHNLSNQAMIAFDQRAQKWLTTNAPNISNTVSSPQFMFSFISLRTFYQMVTGVSFALFLISVLIIISLRSLKIGLLSLVPNIIPPIMAFGLWGLLMGEAGFALALGLTMIIGIIVDDTVHFLSKYMRGRREKNLDAPAAISYAYTQVGSALTITTIVLSVGFSVLMLSTFKLNFELGLITAMTIVIALIVDFLFLPALLLMFDKKSDLTVTSQNHNVTGSTPKVVIEEA